MTASPTASLEQRLDDLVYRHAEPWDRVRQSRRVMDALTDIVAERSRQEGIGQAKRDQGIDWRSCADPQMDGGDMARVTVLAEEFGEVARATLERTYALTWELRKAYERDLRKELVQVAAVALAWLEAIAERADLEDRAVPT